MYFCKIMLFMTGYLSQGGCVNGEEVQKAVICSIMCLYACVITVHSLKRYGGDGE